MRSLLLCILLAGCAEYPYAIKNAEPELFRSLRPSTLLILRSVGVADTDYAADPFAVIHHLLEIDNEDPELQLAFAELCCDQARKNESVIEDAQSLYLLCARSASSYLAMAPVNDAALVNSNGSFAASLYNLAVSRFIIPDQRVSRSWSQDFHIKGRGGNYSISVERDRPGSYDPSYFDYFESALEKRVEGFKMHQQTEGIGAPLIGIRNTGKNSGVIRMPLLSLPVSAVIDFSEAVSPVVTFYNAFKTEFVSTGGRTFPLSADFTAPLALYVDRLKVGSSDLSSFIHSSQDFREFGLYMLEPYDPAKIPVVFVHGIEASPAMFVDMQNELQAVPELRKRYQFIYFRYPTGLPVIYSASLLRNELYSLRKQVDPEEKNEAFDHMVIVGHSMGGVVTRMLVLDAGNSLWDAYFNVRPESAGFSEDELKFVREVFFFKPLPFVKKVVFIAAPHRGSSVASSALGRVGSAVVQLPPQFVTMTKAVLSKAGTYTKLSLSADPDVPTSITQLAPDSPFITNTKDLPVATGVKYYSIIAVLDSSPGDERTDGMVTYDSAHLDGAESELVVHTEHDCLDYGPTIVEVGRILKDN